MLGSAKKFPSVEECGTATMLPLMSICASAEQAHSLSVVTWKAELALEATVKVATKTGTGPVVKSSTLTLQPLNVVTADLMSPTGSDELCMSTRVLQPDPAKGPEKSTLEAWTASPL